MIEYDRLSVNSKLFYDLINKKKPEWLDYATIQNLSPFEDPRLIEECGTLVIEIPTSKGRVFSKIYIEVRLDNILIGLMDITHHHFDWYFDKDKIEAMERAIHYIEDIISERIVFVKRKAFLSKQEYIEEIETDKLQKTRRVLEVYSWNGKYDQSFKKL